MEFWILWYMRTANSFSAKLLFHYAIFFTLKDNDDGVPSTDKSTSKTLEKQARIAIFTVRHRQATKLGRIRVADDLCLQFSTPLFHQCLFDFPDGYAIPPRPVKSDNPTVLPTSALLLATTKALRVCLLAKPATMWRKVFGNLGQNQRCHNNTWSKTF